MNTLWRQVAASQFMSFLIMSPQASRLKALGFGQVDHLVADQKL